MNKVTILILMMAAAITAHTQSHKATKSEADYLNKLNILYSAMPAKFWLGEMGDYGARPEEFKVGDEQFECKNKMDCYVLKAPVIYGPPMDDAGYKSIRNEQEAIKGSDNNNSVKRNVLNYKEFNRYHIIVSVMANLISGERFNYCQPGGYQKLTPPPGWDGWYMGSVENCIGSAEGQTADTSFIFMGAAPTVKERAVEDMDDDKQPPRRVGEPIFPINPDEVTQYKVKNVVLVIQGSKELVSDFMKNVNTASLRAMIDK